MTGKTSATMNEVLSRNSVIIREVSGNRLVAKEMMETARKEVSVDPSAIEEDVVAEEVIAEDSVEDVVVVVVEDLVEDVEVVVAEEVLVVVLEAIEEDVVVVAVEDLAAVVSVIVEGEDAVHSTNPSTLTHQRGKTKR
jgi:hypothetical protein